MNCDTRVFVGLLCAAASFAASGGSGGGGGGVTAPNAAEVRTLNERVPAGGTVQVKHLLTQPRPITSGGWEMSAYAFSIDGIAVSSPLGDAIGAGVLRNGKLTLRVVSPNSDFGMNLDYPFLTITMDIPASTAKGSTYTLDLPGGVVQGADGPLTMTDPKPGTLTIDGSISIRGVYPGGGLYPAGTVIAVRGDGFVPSTRINTKMKTTQAVYVSPHEMRLTLTSPATLDMQPVTAQNPDGSQVTYYSYLRGVPVRLPSTPLLQATEPVFGLATHASAKISASACAANQDLAIAIQNPNPWPVSVVFTDDSTGATAVETIPSGGRLTDTIAAILGQRVATAAISSTSPVQFAGLCTADDVFSVTPFAPSY